METAESPDTLLTPPLRTLLANIIDYAGLFPPAELRFHEALQNYVQYRQDPEAWMLGRFVLPVHRLDELAPFSNLFRAGDEKPYAFSVLGGGGTTPEAFLETFAQEVDLLQRFHADHLDRVRADVMEARLPVTLLDAPIAETRTFLGDVHRRLVRAGTAQLDVFYEVPHDLEPTSLRGLAAALADHNSAQDLPARSTIGLKMRCGGTTPDAFPPDEHVVQVIAACRDAGARFKATAGLHHPIRHYSETYESIMHGFINVFGAAVLAFEHDLDEGGILAIIQEEDPEAFQFTNDHFVWRDVPASADTIQHVRDELAISFGSCSFDEPRDDLKELELIR
jgi:hypothetical protein